MLHDYWLYFDGFGWATLLFAHYWNWTRQRRGGLPWVLSILWLSTWVMLINTTTFALEEWVLGHYVVWAGVNWPHIVQIGASVTFLVLAALALAQVLRLPRMDPAWVVGRLLAATPWRAYAYGQMVVVVAGIALVGAGVIGGNTVLGGWPSDAVGPEAAIGSDDHC